MFISTLRFLCAIGLVLVAITPSQADNWGNYTAGPTFRWLDEVRGGVYIHSPGYKEGDTIALNGELLTSKLPSSQQNRFLRFFLTPRLHVGFTGNLESQTSYAYTGLTWSADLTQYLFAEASFGGGVHNGELEPPTGPDRLQLGCRALFRESASLGWRFNEQWSVMATVEHLSHAGFCSDYNNGITDTGIRIGYKF